MVQTMGLYRCHFLGIDDRIAATEDIKREAVAEAIDLALSMLRARPQHRSVELWRGTEKVFPVDPVFPGRTR
jgi:hypothetical protein